MLTNGSYRDQRAPGTLGQSIDVVSMQVKRDFDINPYSYALNSSRTLDPKELYTRNYAPFNILNELDNNYMDINVGDYKFQGELSWKVIKQLELTAMGAVRYQQSSQQHYVKDNSNQAMAYRSMGTTVIRDKTHTYILIRTTRMQFQFLFCHMVVFIIVQIIKCHHKISGLILIITILSMKYINCTFWWNNN